LHVKVHLVATAVVAVVNPIPHVPASTVWRAVAVGVLVAMVAAVVVVVMAAVLAVAVDAEAAVVAAAMVVAAAVAVRLVADQPCISNTSEVQPYFFSN
jgi:hypothetical protein